VGSYPPNWGTTGDRDPRDFFGGSTSTVTLRPRPDPVSFGLAPTPVTGSIPTTWSIAQPMRPDDRVQTN